MFRPCHLPSHAHPNNILRRVNIIKLIIMQFFFQPPITS
jgi:hypothetical protein